jgi:glycosyltransferase involved in cell wall biosynthesis
MKILEMIATLDPGGAESLVCDLSIDFAQRGAEVKIFLLAGLRSERGELLKERLNRAGVEVLGIKQRKPASAANLLKLMTILNSWKPHVAHCHLYNSEVPLALTRLMFGRKASVYARTLHSTLPFYRCPRIISNALCFFFDYNIACSKAVEKVYSSAFGKNIKGVLATIPNGCSLSESHTDTEEKKQARLKMQLSENDFVFCNVGGFHGTMLATSFKAHDTLLKAFAAAFQDQKNILLVCAGDGPLRKSAQRLAESLGIEEQTRLIGNIPESWPLLRAADVFVIPSRIEGLPIALLEAASTGLPVIASDIPEISSLRPGNSWIICHTDDINGFEAAMVKMKNNFTEYLQLARGESKTIREQYSIKICSQKYWDLFNSALKPLHGTIMCR